MSKLLEMEEAIDSLTDAVIELKTGGEPKSDLESDYRTLNEIQLVEDKQLSRLPKLIKAIEAVSLCSECKNSLFYIPSKSTELEFNCLISPEILEPPALCSKFELRRQRSSQDRYIAYGLDSKPGMIFCFDLNESVAVQIFQKATKYVVIKKIPIEFEQFLNELKDLTRLPAQESTEVIKALEGN